MQPGPRGHETGGERPRSGGVSPRVHSSSNFAKQCRREFRLSPHAWFARTTPFLFCCPQGASSPCTPLEPVLQAPEVLEHRQLSRSIIRRLPHPDRMGAASLITGPRDPLGDFLNSGGWIVVILVFAVTVSILANLVVFRRRRRKLGRVETSLGKILAAVGGFITLVATALPWATVTYSDIPGSYVFLGVAFFGYSSIIVYLFGLAWLTFFALPRKVYAILGLGWGSLALLLALLADAGVFPG